MTSLPSAYVINLDGSTDRLAHFYSFNRGVDAVTRFSAIDGRMLDRNELVASGYITADLPYGPGTLGCAMSHVRLWELAVTADRSITIFEDDVVISDHFQKRAISALSNLPGDWDMIYWGCRLGSSYAWVDLGDIRVRLHCYGRERYKDIEGLKEFQERDVSSAAVRLLHSFGQHGYSISARGARAALEYFLPMRNRLISFPDAGVTVANTSKDVDLCGLYPSIKAFLCIPNLVLPGLHESDRRSKDTAAVAES